MFISAFQVHIFGTAFGGFLAQMYAKNRPRRVESLILCNSYCDSTSFSVNVPLFGMYAIYICLFNCLSLRI